MRPAHFLRYATFLLILCTLSACQTQPKLTAQTPDQSWASQQAAVNAINSWVLRGKIGFRSPESNGSGQLNWLQNSDVFDVRLRGPFGQGAIRVVGSPQGVRVDIAGQGTFYSDSPSKLLLEKLGWSVPVASLSYWIKGINAPGYYDSLTLDDEGRLDTLSQHGWYIDYLRYRRIEKLHLPQKIKLMRDNITITIVTNHWQLTPL